MQPYPALHWGLNVTAFWQEMRTCFAPILDENPVTITRPDATLIPTIRLKPEPAAWPDLAAFDHEGE